MDGFLLALTGMMLVGVGDRPAQLLTALLRSSPSARRGVMAAWLATAVIVCIIAGVAGAIFHGLLAPRPRAMLIGLALLLAGGSIMFRRPPPPLPQWAGQRPRLAAAALGGVRMAGDGGQFIVFAAAAWTGGAALAIIGGALAMAAVGLTAPLLSPLLNGKARPVQRIIGGLLLVIGSIVILSAARLIG